LLIIRFGFCDRQILTFIHLISEQLLSLFSLIEQKIEHFSITINNMKRKENISDDYEPT
jgi:hypothetical protein